MKNTWKTLLLALPVALGAWLLASVAPVIGQNEPGGDRPLVGLEQAQELGDSGCRYMREGKYREAIMAFHSAAFILEEGLGMHAPMMGGPGPGPVPGGERGGGPRMCPPMSGPPQPRDFGTALEHTRMRAADIQAAGGQLGDIMERIEAAQKAFDDGREEEAMEILRTVNEELDRIKRSLVHGQE